MNGLLGSLLGGGPIPHPANSPCYFLQRLFEQASNSQLAGLAQAMPAKPGKTPPSDYATRNPPAFSETTAWRLLDRSIRAFQPKR